MLIDLFLPLIIDVDGIKKDIDSGMSNAANQLGSNQGVTEIALMWVRDTLRKNRTEIKF